MNVMQPAEVLVGLQEASQLLVLRDWLGEQLPPLALLHVPAEQEVCKVLQTAETVPHNCGLSPVCFTIITKQVLHG